MQIRYKSQYLVYLIMTINIVVYLLEVRSSGSFNINQRTLINFGANYGPAVFGAHQYYRLFSAMWIHLSLTHILFNMIALISFATIARSLYNDTEFLTIYLLGGIIGNIGSCFLQYGVVSAGASSAIMALCGSLLSFFFLPKNKYDTKSIVSQAIILLLLNTAGAPMGTDIWSHLFGFIGGFLIGTLFVFYKRIAKKV